jgi:hypothetical protein
VKREERLLRGKQTIQKQQPVSLHFLQSAIVIRQRLTFLITFLDPHTIMDWNIDESIFSSFSNAPSQPVSTVTIKNPEIARVCL